jgi:hypothetical protein
MKKLISLLVIALLLAGARPLAAQDWPEEYLGLPGDNLNLYAVMNLFQESETLEGFERSLNDPKTIINNLDLNGNNLVDYIMVFDYQDGNVHNIVLRVALNQDEYQDVAVFTVEKFRDGSVQIQLIGDEALYGKNYIIEPFYAETPNPGYTGKVIQQTKSTRRNVTVVRTTYYEVASWPVIVYISRPSYRAWRSAWRWGYYPAYWTPWAPSYWHFYYGYHYNHYNHYYAYYRPWSHYRCSGYHTVYHTRIRNYSPTVVVNVNRGSYKNTYSRPDKRSEGEALYSQRRASGATTVPARGQSSRANEVKQSAQLSQRAGRPATEVRNSPARADSRKATETRQSTEVVRSQREAPKANRAGSNTAVQRPATPNREAVARPNVQTNRPTDNKATVNQQRQSTAAPARGVERKQPERNTQANRSVTTASNREKTQTPSVQKQQNVRKDNKAASNVRSSGSKASKSDNNATQRSTSGNNRNNTSGQSGSNRTPSR